MNRLLALCLLLFCTSAAAESGTPITIGEELTIRSEILGEDRQVLISKPGGYESDEDKHYAVLILLDGSSNFHHTTGLVTFLAETGRIPPMFVVGVNNTQRGRDLTPSTDNAELIDEMGDLGGADNFRAFISDELLPWVDENYRTGPYRILVGHSLGGLYALHSMINQPDLFNAYIAISPSLWWDDQILVDQLETFLEATDELDATLYMTMGNEGGSMLGGARKFSGVLDEHAPPGLKWDFRLLNQENHGSVPHRSTYLGLEMIFEGWFLPDIVAYYDEHGLDKVNAHYRRTGKRFGYERVTPSGQLGMLGYQLIEKGRLKETETVANLDPDIYTVPPWMMAELGDAYLEQGQKETAIKYFKQVLERNPGDKSAREKLTEQGIDVTALVPTVDVSPEVLATYLGSYDFDDGTSLTFTLEDGVFYGTPDWGGGKTRLFALSETRFYFDDVDSRVNFEVDDSGVVDSILLDFSGDPYVGKRVVQP